MNSHELSQFAAGLWAVDTALKGASLNFSAMYLHTRELGVTYNLFEPPATDKVLTDGWRTGSVYYAMLVLAESISSSTSVVVDLNLDNSSTSYDATVAGYGIYDGESRNRSKLALFNFDYPVADGSGSGSGSNTTQTFILPPNLANSIGVRYLLAENITEQTAITWAGQTIGSNGDLQGTQAMDSIECADGCNVNVPGPGLAVVWLDPESDIQRSNIYIGNSTIAGFHSETENVSSSMTVDPHFRIVIAVLCTLAVSLFI